MNKYILQGILTDLHLPDMDFLFLQHLVNLMYPRYQVHGTNCKAIVLPVYIMPQCLQTLFCPGQR